MAAVALCLSVLASPAAAQWAAPSLFAGPPVPAAAGPHAVESIAGTIDAAPALRGLGRLRLQLPGGGMVQMARDGFERRRNGDVTWRGRIVGEDDSRVILTLRNGYVAGRIIRGLDEYQIRPGPGGSHLIERIDTSIEPVDEHVVPDVDYSDDPDPGGLGPGFPPPYTNSPDNIQLLVFYTQQALAAAGGEQQIEARIQSMVDQANAAFIDSGMIARISLVRAEEIAYAETGDVRSALDWLVGINPDGSYNYGVLAITAKREFFGADLVSMIVDNEGLCAGAAYVMNEPGHAFMGFAYNVSALSCGAGTLAHEIGHNMGFEHNPEDSPRPYTLPWWPYNVPTSYPWSFGHYVDGSFRTIMSYATPCLSGCPNALLFSNPDVSFLGSPTGIVDQRDNARTGDLTAPIVTNFMDAVTGAVVNRRVIAATDDVEEMADGSIVLDSPVLDLGGVQAVGLRFQNIHIPPGMRVDSAYLEFEAADLGSVATTVEIRAEAADNAAPFSSTPLDVTGRAATLAAVPWDIPAWDTVTEKHYSPDLSAVVQEVLDRPGWLENNSLVITVEGIGLRTALSHDGSAASAPLLHIEYAAPGRPETIEAPVAAFSYSCTGLTCTFTDLSTDADGTIVSWWWDFDNYPFMYSTPEQNPTVTFPADGAYYVLLDIFDDQGWEGVAEKTINVRAANIDPVATDNSYVTDQDVAVSGNVLTDGVPDGDPENDPLTVVGNSSPLNGTVTIAADGAFTYTPSTSFVGIDSFTYTIDDSHGGTATATVTITVNAVNIAPVATDNAYTTNEEVAVSGNVLTDGVPDSDADGDPITVTAITGPPSGRVTITADGAFNYYPDADFFGADSFTYTISDGNGGTATAAVTITVSPVSDMPVASANDYTTDEDVAVSGNVITDGVPDTDADGDTLTVTANSSPLNGALTMSANGAFTYAPAPEFSGTDSFDYTISDGTGGTASATVSITVNTVNDLPVATGNTYAVDEDTVLQGDVINDGIPDSDADGDLLIVTTHTLPMFGDLVVGFLDKNNALVRTWGFGNFTYTPNADFHGSDSFDYTVKDPAGNTATATVTITVNPVNDVPVAAYRFSCVDLTCDFTDESLDKDGAIASWSWNFGDGATSTLQNPTHTYAADGIYAITLTVTDDGGATDVASQSIHVMAGNIAPVATDNAYTTDEEFAVSGNLLTDGVPDSDADGDALTVTANTETLNGTVTLAATGDFTYTPPANFHGVESFAYTATDSKGGTDTATVTITVVSVNDLPVATDNVYTTDEDVSFSGNVLTDGIPDSDADSDTLTVTSRTGPLSGTVTMAGDGHFTYYPAENESGVVSFNYTVGDGNGGSDTATVTITVNSVNDPPVSSFYYSCTGVDCTFSNNSRDVEGPVTWLWDFGDGTTSTVERPSHSYAAIGLYTVTLTVTDNEGATDTSSWVVGNQSPVATNNSYTLDEDTTVSGNFLTDGTPDSDPDGDPLTFSAQTWDLYGTVSINADGSFVYTPVPDYPPWLYDSPGSDSFTYSISDGKGGFDSATVTFWINPINDAPVAGVSYSCYGLYCGFLDRSTDVEGPIASWLWDSGDGATYVTQNPRHHYAAYGTYTVSLTVTDGGGLTHTVTKTLDNPNYAPVGTDNYYTTTVDTPITGNVLKDGTPDSDANGDGLRAALNDGLISGEVSIGMTGYLTYTPAAGFIGKESFTYTVSDGHGGSDTAIVTITVNPANTAPVATDDSYTTAEDTAVSGNVLLDGVPDSDADGDPLTVTANSNPLNGTVTVAANGAFTYTPGTDFNGTDSFTYTVSDGVATATAAVTITVNPVNDAPVASFSHSCAGLTCAFTDGSADVEGAIASWSWSFGDGAVSTAQNPTHVYAAAGTYAVSLTVSDGAGATDTVTQAVTATNTAPVATDDAYATAEDTALSGNLLTDGTPDSDADGDPLTVTANSNPLNGTVTVAANGAFTYTPGTDFNGTDSFTYTVSDGVATATATVSITVNPVNDTPVGSANAYTTAEDVAVSGNVLLDGTPDSDADGDPLTVTANTTALNGAVTVAANGAFTYTPNADFNGSDSFTYTVSDGSATATASVSITVDPVNDAPVASFSHSCAGLNCAFTDGSSDIEGAIAAWSWSFGDGSVSSVQNPTHSYATSGTYSVSLTVTDGAGASDTVTQTVTVTNTTPVATANAYVTNEDTAVSGNVLTDGTPDSDADGDALSVTANSSPLNGTVTVAANGAFTYTPGADFNGSDSFTYTVSDGVATATATVTLTVTPVNDAPVAAFSHSCAGLNCAFTDGSTDIEGAIAAWSWSFGDGVVSTAQSPTHVYAADGTYTVSLTVTDGGGASNALSQTVTVANTAPVATADAYTTAEDTAFSGNVLLDGTPDSDADGDVLTVTANSAPLDGTVTVAANGAFTYTPNADFNGADSFSYTVSDGIATATATVTITVTPVNDAPVATANAYSTAEDTAVSGNVLTDGTPDSDPDGDVLIVIDTTATLGSLSIAADGSFTYTPPANFNGSESFDYSVGDPHGAGATATVTITVTPLNDMPVATDNAYTTAEDVAVSGNVLIDGTPDSDVDGDALSVTANTNPLNGSVTVAANGAFNYTPNADFNGTDSFTYTVSDGIASATATVAITVNPVNDAPVATDDAYATAEDTALSGNVLTDGTPDADADGDALTVTASTTPLNGTVTVAANGAFTYTPDADFNGSDSFAYTVSDGVATATATVTVTVSPVNDAPVAGFGSACTDLDCAFTDSSTDIDGAIAAWSWDFGDGAVSTAQSPIHSYEAVDGTYTVSLTVTDDLGASATASRQISVVNPFPPTAPTNLIAAKAASSNLNITTGTLRIWNSTASSSFAVNLNWTDTSINEESFIIERCRIRKGGLNPTCLFEPVAQIAANSTTFAEVLSNGSYRYRVKARNRNGDSGYSNVATILK